MKKHAVVRGRFLAVLISLVLPMAVAVGCRGESRPPVNSDSTRYVSVDGEAERRSATGIDVTTELKSGSEQEAPQCALLEGEIDSSSHWGSGWILLVPSLDFLEGDTLRISVGGTAEKILARLLPEGVSAAAPVGILGRGRSVPEDRIVEVTLAHNRPRVEQLSVHGGPKPWGKYDLGANNGNATISSVEWCRTKGGGG